MATLNEIMSKIRKSITEIENESCTMASKLLRIQKQIDLYFDVSNVHPNQNITSNTVVDNIRKILY
jgi:NurA-like 5'-3' nuclease